MRAALGTALLLLALTAAAPASGAGPKHWCGAVHGQGEGRDVRFRVRVEQGHVACRRARRVIKYVTTHGKLTMGSMGRSPRGWSCGWGYGVYHHDREQTSRSGPICTRHGVQVEGYGPGYSPA